MAPTVVVSPLIALMRDQVAQLRHFGIAAACLTRRTTRRRIAGVLGCRARRRPAPPLSCRRNACRPAHRECWPARASVCSRSTRRIACRNGATISGPNIALLATAPRLGGVPDHRADRHRRRVDPRDILAASVREPRIFIPGFDRPNLRLAMRRRKRRSDSFFVSRQAPAGKRHRLLSSRNADGEARRSRSTGRL